MEYCEGGQVNDREYADKHEISPSEVGDYLPFVKEKCDLQSSSFLFFLWNLQITQNLGKLFSEMIFVHGYVHCDPHPGNILIHKAAGKLEITLLDHGLYSVLNRTFFFGSWLNITVSFNVVRPLYSLCTGILFLVLCWRFLNGRTVNIRELLEFIWISFVTSVLCCCCVSSRNKFDPWFSGEKKTFPIGNQVELKLPYGMRSHLHS